MGLDVLTLAMAKAHCDSKGGYVEQKTRQYHWNGDTFGLAVFPGELLELDVNFYRVSSDIITAVKNPSMTVYKTSDGKYYSVGNEHSVEETGAFLIFGTSGLGHDVVHCILLKSDLSEDIPAGVYFAKSDDLFAESLDGAYSETIVPIDPKYLGDKVINLAKYIPSTYNSFNDIVLALFAEGGGRLIFHNDTTFWSDVDKYNHLKFAIDANELVPGLMVECASNSRTISEGVTTSIEFSFLVFLNGCMRATVAFQRDTNLDNSIIVAVEPLTIPGA